MLPPERSRIVHQKIPLFESLCPPFPAISMDVRLGSVFTSDKDGVFAFHTSTLAWSGPGDRFLLTAPKDRTDKILCPLDLIFLFVFDLGFFCTACRSSPRPTRGGEPIEGPNGTLHPRPAPHAKISYPPASVSTTPILELKTLRTGGKIPSVCHLLGSRRWNSATTPLNRYPIALPPQTRG